LVLVFFFIFFRVVFFWFLFWFVQGVIVCLFVLFLMWVVFVIVFVFVFFLCDLCWYWYSPRLFIWGAGGLVCWWYLSFPRPCCFHCAEVEVLWVVVCFFDVCFLVGFLKVLLW